MTLEVLGHRVMLKPDKVEEKSDGGIILHSQEEAKKREKAGTIRGTIVGVGDTAWMGFADNRPWAKVGDRVYYAKHSGKFIIHNAEEYVIINDEDVQARIVGDEEDV